MKLRTVAPPSTQIWVVGNWLGGAMRCEVGELG
jgi:hypothetical protein